MSRKQKRRTPPHSPHSNKRDGEAHASSARRLKIAFMILALAGLAALCHRPLADILGLSNPEMPALQKIPLSGDPQETATLCLPRPLEQGKIYPTLFCFSLTPYDETTCQEYAQAVAREGWIFVHVNKAGSLPMHKAFDVARRHVESRCQADPARFATASMARSLFDATSFASSLPQGCSMIILYSSMLKSINEEAKAPSNLALMIQDLPNSSFIFHTGVDNNLDADSISAHHLIPLATPRISLMHRSLGSALSPQPHTLAWLMGMADLAALCRTPHPTPEHAEACERQMDFLKKRLGSIPDSMGQFILIDAVAPALRHLKMSRPHTMTPFMTQLLREHEEGLGASDVRRFLHREFIAAQVERHARELTRQFKGHNTASWLQALEGWTRPSPPSPGELAVSGYFQKGMIWQQGKPHLIWGMGMPGTSVTASVSPEGTLPAAASSCVVSGDGTWNMTLPALAGKGLHSLSVSDTQSRIDITGILPGDLWIVTGQSNMHFQLGNDVDRGLFQLNPSRPLRLCIGRPSASGEPPLLWTPAGNDTSPSFSSVGIFFAQHIQSRIETPLGLLQATDSGLSIRSFTDPGSAPPESARFISQLDPSAVRIERDLLRKISGIPIKGILFYQGETDVGLESEHKACLRSTLDTWKKRWGPDITLCQVLLPGYNYESIRGKKGAPVIRQNQWDVAKETGTLIAACHDQGHPTMIHTNFKRVVGERLARLALQHGYGMKEEAHGPEMDRVEFKGSDIIVHLTHAEGLKTRDMKPAIGFLISGQDGKFEKASARVEEGRIVLSHPGIPNPVEARYDWVDMPEGNVINNSGIPLIPFRVRTPH